MEKKYTAFDYLSQTFIIYGVTILLLNFFALIFGEKASGVSSIFRLGAQGISVQTSLQFLLVVAVIIFLRFIFFSDSIFKGKVPLTARIILMFVCAMAVTVLSILLFGWFPADNFTAWVMFIICFAVSCTVSTIITDIKERQENKALEEALRKVKEEM